MVALYALALVRVYDPKNSARSDLCVYTLTDEFDDVHRAFSPCPQEVAEPSAQRSSRFGGWTFAYTLTDDFDDVIPGVQPMPAGRTTK